VIDGSWSSNYGCNGPNGPDCIFKTNSEGSVRFIVKASSSIPQLSTDFSFTALDLTVPYTCVDKFAGKDVRASGNFSNSGLEWNAAEPTGLMTFQAEKCDYSVVLTGLRPNYAFEWKVSLILNKYC
jgi:hypothetical protein